MSSGALHSQGDADLDADVDGGDFLVWQRTLKPTAASATSSSLQSAIPEPATPLLALIAVSALAATHTSRSAIKQRNYKPAPGPNRCQRK